MDGRGERAGHLLRVPLQARALPLQRRHALRRLLQLRRRLRQLHLQRSRVPCPGPCPCPRGRRRCGRGRLLGCRQDRGRGRGSEFGERRRLLRPRQLLLQRRYLAEGEDAGRSGVRGRG